MPGRRWRTLTYYRTLAGSVGLIIVIFSAPVSAQELVATIGISRLKPPANNLVLAQILDRCIARCKEVMDACVAKGGSRTGHRYIDWLHMCRKQYDQCPDACKAK